MKANGRRVMARGERLLITVLLAAGVIAGCATARTAESREKIVWQGGEQFVKIERQDRPAGGVFPANRHPVDVPAVRLRSALESIEVRQAGDEKGARLFNVDELDILSENVRAGLAVAGPA